MKGLEFPIIGTKVRGLNHKFDISSPEGRKEYFEFKAGDEIVHIKKYLEKNSFIAFLLGKKNSGKGTYSKLLSEIFAGDKIIHVSVGDLVRDIHSNWKEFRKSEEFNHLKRLYRGYISFDEAIDTLLGRSTDKLLPTEFILALLKHHIEDLRGKTLFIDGLPREMDQVSYSLFFRDLINYRNTPDMFVLIDIPESVINERMKYRVVCPRCKTSRNTKLLITSKVEYDPKKKEFYLLCDNPDCSGDMMIAKEGDDLGIEPIRGRLIKDEEILQLALRLHGIPKILLRNHVPVDFAKKYFDDYELTPEYEFEWDDKKRKVKIKEKLWTISDDNGVESFSLLAPAVVVAFLKQLVEVLEI